MRTDKKKWFNGFMFTVLGMLLAGMFSLMSAGAVLAASDSLEITGEGVTNPVTFTRDQLGEMEQHQCVYSCINTWPTKKWYVGKGVKLCDLLDEAGMTGEATMLKFSSVDGYTVTLTVKELLQDKRYRYTNFKTGGDDDGHVPGDLSGKVEVEPIIALVSVEGSDNPGYMNDVSSLLLMLGQRAVTEQTGNLFVKYLNKIEVLTAELKQWDAPQANPGSGTVPAGSMVTLSNMHSDDDKIYYTTDGSTPDMNSPVYNWIASRWWAARADVLGTINKPIGPINEDTIIKAVTIGPGKLDSDVVTYNYRVAGAEPLGGDGTPVGELSPPDQNEGAPGQPATRVIKLSTGVMEASIDGSPYTLDAAPYVDTRAGRTLVPVRFVGEALGAGVDWNPDTGLITISDGGKNVVMTLGSSDVRVNGVQQAIDCAPEIVSGRTFVPLRFISETLGAGVDYDSGSGQVLIKR